MLWHGRVSVCGLVYIGLCKWQWDQKPTVKAAAFCVIHSRLSRSKHWETGYVVMSRDRHAGPQRNVKICNKSFGKLEQFRYLGTTLTNENRIHKESKSRLKSGNAWNHSVQIILSSSFLSKNAKIKIYRTIILPVVLYGCETWSVTLSEEYGLRVFKNRVLRKILGPKRDEVNGEWRRLHNEQIYDL